MKRLVFAVALSLFGLGLTGCSAADNSDLGQSEGNATGKLKDFKGFVTTDSGDIFVHIRTASNAPAGSRPLVYLSGIAARSGASAEDPFLDRLHNGGVTLIKIILPGQGETLARDLEKTDGASIDHDVRAQEQVTAVLNTLKALQVAPPVNIAGLSYGGAMTLASKALAGDRIFDKTMMLAPELLITRDTSFDWMRLNPWYAGTWWSTSVGVIRSAFPAPPPALADNPQAFWEGTLRLYLGRELFDFKSAIRGRQHVYLLAVPGDTLAPPDEMDEFTDLANNGVLSVVPENIGAQHFVTGTAPEYAANWVLSALSGELDK